ncbi:MAG: hypothetical protein MMC33_005451 [Icmadophila ericetorum]|nr:hypothetical protein [Icmadophila ericetorum]
MTAPVIPIVDISPFILWDSDGEESRRKAAKELVDACHRLGFVYISGYGVSEKLLEEALEWTKQLYDLPLEDKMKAPHPPTPTPHRGYSPIGLEKVYSKQEASKEDLEESRGESVRKIMDFKESYEIGSENNPSQPNIWLPEPILPNFQRFMQNFYWELDATAKALLSAFSLGLQLSQSDAQLLFAHHSGHNNQLRLLHYPPVVADDLQAELIARMPAHTDWSSFTLLFQDSTGGLELEPASEPGKFVPATPIPGTCVLNVGDMLQRLSNDYFPSATHRVTLPPARIPPRTGMCEPTSSPEFQKYAPKITRERYSIPYFVAPDSEAMIAVLKSGKGVEMGKERYEAVLYREYGGFRGKFQYVGNMDVNGKENGAGKQTTGVTEKVKEMKIGKWTS